MKKINTLKKNYEFKYVLSSGRFYREKHITAYIKENRKKKNIIGIAVNTKSGKAVRRNRVKRLIRENYRLLRNQLIDGYNIVFLWNRNSNIEDANFFDIQKEMLEIFQKAKIFKK